MYACRLLAGAMFVSALRSASAVAVDSRGPCDEHRFPDVVLSSDGAPLPEVAGGSWLLIDEQGQRAVITGKTDDDVFSVAVPPRFGRTFVTNTMQTPRSVRKHSSEEAPGFVHVSSVCVGSGIDPPIIAWWRKVADISSRVERGASRFEGASLRDEIHELAASAPDDYGTAVLAHMTAQVMLVSREFPDAVLAFNDAEKQWLNMADARRARAAAVGRVESMSASGRYQDVVNSVKIPATMTGLSYYDVRVVNSRCLALHYLRRLREAAGCYEWLQSNFLRLDERIDYVNTLRNYADLELAMGQPVKAMELARRVFVEATGSNAPMVRGRAKLTSANISLARGDIAGALTDANEALSNFGLAKAPAWEGDALLKAATIYAQLGAKDEAYLSVTEAFGKYSRDEPALVAGALVAYADIERTNFRYGESIQALQAAVSIYARLKMPTEFERARLVLARVQLEQGSVDLAYASLASIPGVSPTNAPDRALIAIAIAARRNELDVAKSLVTGLRGSSLSLPQMIEFARLDAEIAHRGGDDRRAEQVLSKALVDIGGIVSSTRSPLLHLLVARQAGSLQRSEFAGLLDHRDIESDASLPAEVWRWLVRVARIEHGSRRPTSTVVSEPVDRLDRAISVQLMGGASSLAVAAESQRELLAFLAWKSAFAPVQDATAGDDSLSSMQATLGERHGVLALVDGGDRQALLYATHDGAWMFRVDDTAAVNRIAGRLRELLVSPNGANDSIDAAASELSSALFAHAPALPLPDRLDVVSSDALRGVPWPVVSWPGHAGALVESTAVSEGLLDTPRVRVQGPAPDKVQVFVPQQFGASSGLPVLAMAAEEADMMRDALHTTQVAVVAEPRATRTNLLSALDEKGAWVHLAAHGAAQPNRLGYAGVWLDAAGDDAAPEFMSWLDVIDHGTSAALVVLDACQLGDSGDAVRGNISFANAVAEAGAGQVVAASWRVSDAASATWVPSFYGAIAADPNHDAAAALRIAQLELKHSRRYRHPFYWAGLQAYAHLTLFAPAK